MRRTQPAIAVGTGRITLFASLLRQVRRWHGVRRRMHGYFWIGRRNDERAFLVMLGLPAVAVAGIVYVAYLDGARAQPARARTVDQEASADGRRANELKCLAENIYCEARGESIEGQYAVADVTVNRCWAENIPHTICDVVHEPWWDPSRGRSVADVSRTEFGPSAPPSGQAWNQATAVASAAFDDLHAPVVPGVLLYHATTVAPKWSRNRTVVATIGNHVFYRQASSRDARPHATRWSPACDWVFTICPRRRTLRRVA